MSNKEIKDEIQRQYKLLDNAILKQREYKEVEEDEYRNLFQRDYARILYSSSFRRLQGKMQILGVCPTAFYRNRLTHSLEVSQIACSIAYVINKQFMGNDPIYQDDLYVLQAAALAHDIGHPAFGHSGERVLDSIEKQNGRRFEGNAQNFRVLRLLERRYAKFDGLNLTNRVLLAINKYLVEESQDKSVKKFLYKEDYEYLKNIRNQCGLEGQRTLDVQIIDIADEIAYATHDLEDALSLRYFNIDELLFELRQKDSNAEKLLEEIVNKAKETANSIKEDYRKNLQNYTQVFRRKLTSMLTDTFVKDITLKKITNNDTIKEHGIKKNMFELSLDKYDSLCHKLSKVIFKCVQRDYDIALYEQKGEIVLRSLYDLLSNKEKNKNGKLLPVDYRPINKNNKDDFENSEDFINQLKANTVNYIAGMMDTFAIEEYERLFKESFDDIQISKYPSREIVHNTRVEAIVNDIKKEEHNTINIHLPNKNK